MKVYHGNNTENLTFEKHVKSRYGFTVLFFATEKRLAEFYAVNQKSPGKKSFVYSLEIAKPLIEIDFNLEISHSIKFRNLIHRLYREQAKTVLLKNIFDRPSDSFPFVATDIVAVFNLDFISNNLQIEKVIE